MDSTATKKLTINEKTEGDITIIALGGFVDTHTAPLLESAIGRAVESNINKIVVNFEDLDYINSTGLGVFMVFIETVRESGGDIKLCAMKPKVFAVFDLLGFPMLFDIVESNEVAVSRFA